MKNHKIFHFPSFIFAHARWLQLLPFERNTLEGLRPPQLGFEATEVFTEKVTGNG